MGKRFCIEAASEQALVATLVAGGVAHLDGTPYPQCAINYLAPLTTDRVYDGQGNVVEVSTDGIFRADVRPMLHAAERIVDPGIAALINAATEYLPTGRYVDELPYIAVHVLGDEAPSRPEYGEGSRRFKLEIQQLGVTGCKLVFPAIWPLDAPGFPLPTVPAALT